MDLMDALRHSQEALTKDDIVEQTAKSLSVQLEGVAKLWMGPRLLPYRDYPHWCRSTEHDDVDGNEKEDQSFD